MTDPIIIKPYDTNWKDKFLKLAKPIKDELGDIALRIDHIGSTSIPHLQAKPVIDIQISITDFDLLPIIEPKLNQLGYIFHKDNPDKTHLFFREKNNERNVHIHIRKAHSFAEVFHLLFRDYLRSHKDECRLYEQTKLKLAKKFKHERAKYTEGKSDVIWDIMQRAYKWNQIIGWFPGDSDL